MLLAANYERYKNLLQDFFTKFIGRLDYDNIQHFLYLLEI